MAAHKISTIGRKNILPTQNRKFAFVRQS